MLNKTKEPQPTPPLKISTMRNLETEEPGAFALGRTARCVLFVRLRFQASRLQTSLSAIRPDRGTRFFSRRLQRATGTQLTLPAGTASSRPTTARGQGFQRAEPQPVVSWSFWFLFCDFNVLHLPCCAPLKILAT